MQELRGKYVNVVLTVQEGKGMDFLKNNIFIVANFNGRIMESDPCEPKCNPNFSTELVWESEKKDLRKVRSVNSPLRVECYTLDEYQKKECVGFSLLSLRSAPIIPHRNPEVDVPFKWYKLLGVPGEYKSSHPELYLSLTIRDHMANKELPPAIPYPDFCSSSSSFLDREVIPIRFLQDGFIQIGDENAAKQAFALTIYVKEACNLHLLLPENLVFKKAPNKYYLSFIIFGLTLKSKPFYKDLHEPIQLEERVCIKLLSSYQILKTFFEQYYDAIVSFYNGPDKLGVTKIKMKCLVEKEELEGTAAFEESCVFSVASQDIEDNQEYEEVDDIKPYVHIECRLDKMQDERTENYEEPPVELEEPPQRKIDPIGEENNDSTPPKKESKPQIQQGQKNPTHKDGYGDQIGDCKVEKMLAPQRKPDNKTKSMQTFMPKIEEGEEFCSKSTPILKSFNKVTVKKVIDVEDIEELDNLEVPTDKTTENYKQFSFFIMAESVIWKRAISYDNFIVKFFHPKANTVLTIKTDIENLTLHRKHILDNVHCKLFFVSQESLIREIIQNRLPKIVFEDAEGHRLFEDIILDASEFLEGDLNEITTICELTSVKDCEGKGEITISMFLEEVSLALTQTTSDTDLYPQILDESIVATSLEDLQKWKDDQMSDYLTHLKLLEKIHLTKLTKEWNKRKLELEEKLINSVEKCKKLSRDLQKTKASLNVDKALENRRKAIQCHQDLNFNEDLYKNMLKYSHCDNIELLTKITEIRLENEELRETIKEQKFELEKTRKNTLTNEQTTNLLQELKTLQEKYEELQKAKTYFKEEWKKAVKEIHDLKTDFTKTLHSQIQSNKEELNQLKFDRLYGSTNFVQVPEKWEVQNYNDFNFGVVKNPNAQPR